MAAMLKLSLSYLNKNKIQNGFITLLILLSTLLVSTAVIILANTGNLFNEMHNRTNGSHQILTFDKGLNDPTAVHDWWAAQDGVEVSPLLTYRTLSGITFKGTDIPNLYLYMMNTPSPPWAVDELVFSSGTQSSAPAQGTIWIPTSMANGYDMAVGDTVNFKTGSTTLDLRVSGIVVDVPYGAPFTNTARIWMNSTDYQSDFQAIAGKDNHMMGIHFDDYHTNSSYWERYASETGAPFLETKMEFESISSFYLIINQIIGFIMIFLGAVMMVIALITIGFTISDAILANYKTIGILKSLGLTSGRTIGTYVIQYALLSIIAVIPGLAMSVFVSKFIINISVSSLRTGNGDVPMEGIGAAMLVGILLFALVILFVVLYAKKARSIEPVQAIRYGMSETENTRLARRMNSPLANRVGFARLPVAAVIGIRNLIKNTKSSVLMLLLTTMAASVLVLGYVVLTSITGIYQTAAKWGYDNANIAAVVVNKTTFPRAELQNVLEEDPRIKNVGWQGNITGVILPDDSTDVASQSTSLYLRVLDGSYQDLGFETLRGNNPELENEISIGVSVAKMFNKDMGDLIDLYIEGEKRTFMISGIYQAISDLSVSGRITAQAVRSVNPDYGDVNVAFINVNDPSQAGAIANQLNERFKDSASIVTQKTLLDSVYAEAASIFVYPMALIGLLFILVTFIIIFSTCRISIRKESKTYGIYKSIGMTSRRIRLSVALGVAALSTIGAILGIVVGVYMLPILLEKVLSGYGIVQIPLILNWGGILLFACMSILAAALGSWVSSRVIRDASPRILVVE
ncbi:MULTISPECIES: ABC transporter permease [unclassified Paenibacillus]|uniref:ABC transporter permease n=1 Tax=unclassified Paenibacillus TaxID=185978 RepID=UPI00041B0BF3|nr:MULTISPECIES: ABC transporter permease [unclassified Paenibacillus]KGP81308.1 ABC transporter permease [Paenibacillus sp. MAEPY2]KGP87531.1 ABC transporter permease [Paenibacillus sp. MAEPY1]